ncbi:MAG: UvrB/UvrC motif-containing protein [Clostridiales bacterium]|nr:UvrB/UvrC motif-containing protein [Clostridiales bacterium]
MRCERCGGPIDGNKIIRLNGVTICEKCARELRIDTSLMGGSILDQAFPMLNELTNAFLNPGPDLEFANTKIRCPKCGTTLRDVESSGQVGCIECYNVFNETVLKKILKSQGNSEYKGRNPGELTETEAPVRPGSPDEEKHQEQPKPAAPRRAKATPKEPTKKDLLERIKKADLGMISDSDLEEAMKLAAEKEDYDLAARFRDELKSRKEDK